jgi:ribose transport system ATP-binding protein
MNVAALENKNVEQSMLYETMVGKESSSEYYQTDRQTQYENNVVLSVRHLGLFGKFKDVSFDLHRGEVLGICGVIGSGKEEVCACITGDERRTFGTIQLFGMNVVINSPADALKKGILSVPKWRNEEGVFGTMSISENISMSNLNNVTAKLLLSTKKQKDFTKKWIDRLRIKCPEPRTEVQQLSGGNVQKVVFARVLSSGAKILILNHPTRGVDVGAKEEIYSIIRDMTGRGVSVILLSDTLEECIGLSNNILVMKDGHVSNYLNASADSKPTQKEILRYMV